MNLHKIPDALRKYNKAPLYPLLLGIYPIISLYQANFHIVPFEAIIRSLLIVIAITLTIQIIMSCVYRNTEKGAILTGIILIGIFNYSALMDQLTDLKIGNLIEISKTSISLGILIVVLSTSSLSLKLKDATHRITKFLQLFLFAIYLVTVSSFFITTKAVDTKGQNKETLSEKVKSVTQELLRETDCEKRRDIYYIILDGRARSEILEETYGYEDEEVIRTLEDLGFIIATESTTNYMQTLLSVSATLNMQYHKDFWKMPESNSSYRKPLEILLNNNVVENYLKNLGYEVHVISAGFSPLTEKNPQDIAQKKETRLQEEFEQALLGKMPLWKYTSTINNKKLRNTILDAFEKTKKVSLEVKPTFTYTHILPPHPPLHTRLRG